VVPETQSPGDFYVSLGCGGTRQVIEVFMKVYVDRDSLLKMEKSLLLLTVAARRGKNPKLLKVSTNATF